MVQRWQDRITIDPDIHHGDPCIKGTRIPVGILLGSLADGLTLDQILGNYPQLNKADIFAALAYAAEVLRQEILLPLSG
jgi:uncharacterized protein (DUF433 family)